MGCRILVGREEGMGLDESAVLYCSTTEWAFGPVFSAHEETGLSALEMAEAFLRFVADHGPIAEWPAHNRLGRANDPRSYSDEALEKIYGIFLERLARCPECGKGFCWVVSPEETKDQVCWDKVTA